MLNRLANENENKQSWWIYERARYAKLPNLIRKILAFSKIEREIYDNFQVEGSTKNLLKIIN